MLEFLIALLQLVKTCPTGLIAINNNAPICVVMSSSVSLTPQGAALVLAAVPQAATPPPAWQTPAGTVDGTNGTFTFPAAVDPTRVTLLRDGIAMFPGPCVTYAANGLSVTFTPASQACPAGVPQPGEALTFR